MIVKMLTMDNEDDSEDDADEVEGDDDGDDNGMFQIAPRPCPS